MAEGKKNRERKKHFDKFQDLLSFGAGINFSKFDTNAIFNEFNFDKFFCFNFTLDIQFENYNSVSKLTVYYEYNDLFSLLVLLRVVFVFRILMANTAFYSNSAHRVS